MADPSTPPRDGPLLRVVGGCEGCAHLRSEYYYDGDIDAGFVLTCAHPNGKRDQMYNETPPWCPRLPDARAALGRELVESSEGGEHG